MGKTMSCRCDDPEWVVADDEMWCKTCGGCHGSQSKFDEKESATGATMRGMECQHLLNHREMRGSAMYCGACETEIHDDSVNHPKHYTRHPSGIECIQITEHMGFNLGNAVKYIWRADLKGNAIEDLRKAKWYLEREIAKRGG